MEKKTIILQSNKTCEKIITSAGEKEGRKGKKNNSITEQGKINDKEGENAVGGGLIFPLMSIVCNQ